MRFLLIALIGLLTLSTAFGWDPGPAPGVKLKNGILYLLTLGLLLRMSLDRRFRIELPSIQIAFGVLFVYSLITFLFIIFVTPYPYYNVLANALDLKGVVDQALFFIVFFYAVRSEEEAIRMLKYLLIAFVLSNGMAVLGALGIAQVGDIEQRTDGRVQGFVGESNQYGAFVAMTLPAVVAVAFSTRGMQRLLWLGGAMITAVTLIMTVSRGAYVATFVAGVCGLIMFARYAPRGRIAMVAGIGVVAGLVLGAVAVSLGFGQLLYERLVSSTSGDLVSTSSGRTEIWANLLAKMLENPITFLTGYGWRSYWSMGFRFSPHNHYLNQLFNLGLIGLVCSIVILAVPLRAAKAAVQRASGAAQVTLMGFVLSTIALAVAAFFVDLYLPWLYFWAYAGIATRLALCVQERVPAVTPVQTPKPAESRRVDNYGWTAARN